MNNDRIILMKDLIDDKLKKIVDDFDNEELLRAFAIIKKSKKT